VSGDRGRHRCVPVTFPASAAFLWSAAAGIPAACWGTALRETAGPRRQSDGATLGCRAFPRPTRRIPRHSRAACSHSSSQPASGGGGGAAARTLQMFASNFGTLWGPVY
jgi:hypothetical protein